VGKTLQIGMTTIDFFAFSPSRSFLSVSPFPDVSHHTDNMRYRVEDRGGLFLITEKQKKNPALLA
jgi:hypothetical protein